MILLRKACRDLWLNRKTYGACMFLIALGIMIYLSMGIAVSNLEIAKEDYYKTYRLADIFAKVQLAPESLIHTLLALDGIEDANMRIVTDGQLETKNNQIATIRMISVLDTPQPLNNFTVIGREPLGPGEIYIGEDFLQAHGYQIDDTLDIILHGRIKTFTIAGAAQSPEFVYVMKDSAEILPNPLAFTIAYCNHEDLAYFSGMAGFCNDITFQLAEGYDFEDVKIILTDTLQQYGLVSLYEKKDQMSYSFVEMEINSSKSMSTSIPLVFMLIAAAVLYLTLKRVIEQDRMQIGLLKAFGYGNTAILAHYLFYGVITGFAGGILGIVSGLYLTGVLSNMFNEFFHLPAVPTNTSFLYILKGMALAIGFGIAGTFAGVKNMLRLQPAESMRPPAPSPIKNDILKIVPALQYVLSPEGAMAVRNILREKTRSLFIITGTMLSFSMLAFMASYDAMIDDMLLSQYTKIQLYDAKIILKQPISYNSALSIMDKMENVILSEGILETAVEIQNRHRKENVVITGLENDYALYKIYDSNRKAQIPLTDGGVILSNGLADKLEASVGDIVTLSFSPGIEDKEVIITEIVTQNLGLHCYMDLQELSSLLQHGALASSIIIKTNDVPTLQQTLAGYDNIATIEDKNVSLENYRQILGSYTGLIVIMQAMAAAVAFAVIYNTASISLSQRKREYATLRVLGLYGKEISGIMGFEYWILSVIAMVLGLPCTYILKQGVSAMMVSDLFSFPTHTPVKAYITAIAVCCSTVLICNWLGMKNIQQFDMVESLKARD